jgi:hypothetical protein
MGAAASSSHHCHSHGRRSSKEPEDVENYATAYVARALRPMLEWIERSASVSDHFFQYHEVISELNKYAPKHGCALVFVRLILLPTLASFRSLSEFPESLIVILNTLHLVTSEMISLVYVMSRGPDLVFRIQNEDGQDGRHVTQTYALLNYLNPKGTWLVPVEGGAMQFW